MEIWSEMVENGKALTKGQILAEVPYSKAVIDHPKRVFESKGWEELKKEAEKKGIILEIFTMFYEILRDKKDKRARLEAGKTMAQFFDMFPEQKTKIMGLFGRLNE